MRLGIIDIGTNSIHAMVAARRQDGTMTVTLHRRCLARLGQGGLARGRLTASAMRRAEQVVARYAAILKRHGVNRVEAVATSAVREASNGRAFVRRIRRRLGLPLRIISGREEARLIYLGARQEAQLRRPAMLISLGGGSAQVMVGDGRRLRMAISRSLGCARLAEQFIHHDPPRADEVTALERAVRRAWAPVVRMARRHQWRETLGSSSMIQQVLAAANAIVRHSADARVTQASLRKLVAWLSTSTVAQRRRLPGLDPTREDLALTTSVALLALMEGCGIRSLRFAHGSLREGLVADDVLQHGGGRLTAMLQRQIMRGAAR